MKRDRAKTLVRGTGGRLWWDATRGQVRWRARYSRQVHAVSVDALVALAVSGGQVCAWCRQGAAVQLDGQGRDL